MTGPDMPPDAGGDPDFEDRMGDLIGDYLPAVLATFHPMTEREQVIAKFAFQQGARYAAAAIILEQNREP